jgi:prevent-host-death family protein
MTTLPLGEVETHLSELVGRVHDHHERVTVTVHGRPSAVLLSVEVGERLLPPLADRFSARRGTYRIIYRIDDATRTVRGRRGPSPRRIPNPEDDWTDGSPDIASTP